jgi:hypothetical protein
MVFGVDAAQREASHWLLLRVSGWVADDLTSRCRLWLRQGRLLDMGHAVAYAAVAQRLRLAAADIELLGELLASDGTDTSALEMLEVCDLDPVPRHGFVPTRALAEVVHTPAADIPALGCVDAGPEDDRDHALIAAAAARGTVRALWRAWRICGDAAWPPPRRVYVVEADVGEDLVTIAGALQDVARQAGEWYPQIEVYPGRGGDRVAVEPPSYQRLARDHGALLWARRADPGLRLAAGYDRMSGPGFRDAAECERFLRYLARGVPVEQSPVLGPDALHPSRPLVVPTAWRTDGWWVWSDATAYYLREYHLLPDHWFLADLRARDFGGVEVDDATVYRARMALLTGRFRHP